MDPRRAAHETAKDREDAVCAYASSAFEGEKRRRLDQLSLSATAYFFTKGVVVRLSGTPFEDLRDEKDHLRFALPLFAQALSSWAVLIIAESWVVGQCASCGEHLGGEVGDDHCCKCGAELGAPEDNPYRVESLVGLLQFRDRRPYRNWRSAIRRDPNGLVSHFNDQDVGETSDRVGGHLTGLWSTITEHSKSFLRCASVVSRELGLRVSERPPVHIALKSELSHHSDEYLRIDLTRLHASTRILPWNESDLVSEEEVATGP